MNANTTTATISANDVATYKGAIVTLHLANETVTGHLISINSKGWNVNVVDGDRVTVVSRSYGRVLSVTTEVPVEAGNVDLTDAPADLGDLDDMTTAELADLFGTTAKELRVTLRSLGLGVGKGRRYHLTADNAKAVQAVMVAATPA